MQKAPNESEASSRLLKVSLINLCHVVLNNERDIMRERLNKIILFTDNHLQKSLE